MQINDKEWMDAREASRFLSITYGALRNMVYRREIPFYKLGRRLRFCRFELRQFLESSRCGLKEWGNANQSS